jgi:hypothetical protein
MPATHVAIREARNPDTSSQKIVERLGANPGVRPDDVLISVVETAAENWSFGNGETQFYKALDAQEAAA